MCIRDRSKWLCTDIFRVFVYMLMRDASLKQRIPCIIPISIFGAFSARKKCALYKGKSSPYGHLNQAPLDRRGSCVFWGHIEPKFVFIFYSVYLRSRLKNITNSHMLGAPQVEKAKGVKLHRTSIDRCSYPMAYKTLFPFLNVPVNSWNEHIV